MITISGYKIQSQIYSSKTVNIYHAITLSDNSPVIIKVLSDESSSQKEIAKIKYEYSLLNSIESEGVIRAIKLEQSDSRYALILEPIPNGVTLSEFLSKEEVNLDLFLSISLQLARIIQSLHQKNIIHTNLHPSNILINPHDHKLKIVDLRFSTQTMHEYQELLDTDRLSDSVAYLSPELILCPGIGIDKRTDFYPLGMIYYLMLTGQLPFSSENISEWLYFHIAKQPKSLKEINSTIPDTLSSIVMKLLSKMPEDRYQSAQGIVEDLETFSLKRKDKKELEPLKLGLMDHVNNIFSPHKLYGRELEVEKLISAFSRVSLGERELFLLHGDAGIGKTALVNDLHRSVIKSNGYFLFGRFEKSKQTIPYFALIQALRLLIKNILNENEKKREQWKQDILTVLSPNARIIINVIPELELLVGKQQHVPDLADLEAKNRFQLVFFDFLQVFAKAEHPLVIFLDNLQWADEASFSLMKKMLQNKEMKYCMIVGAYQNKNLERDHLLLRFIEEAARLDIPMDNVALKPLDLFSIRQLIVSSLNAVSDLNQFSEIIYKKTGGNPLLCNILLREMIENKHLVYDEQKNQWSWQASDLQGMSIEGDIVDLFSKQILSLPKETQEALKIASCMGDQFDLKSVATIYEKSLSDTAKILSPALQMNIIYPISSEYRLIFSDQEYGENHIILYRFFHDSSQTALINSMTADQVKLVHMKLARLLMHSLSESHDQEDIFEVLNHYNLGSDLIENVNERLEAAKLNLHAGKKSRELIAYQSAAHYYTYAISYLGDAGWQMHYLETLAAHIGYAESIHLLGQFIKANELFSSLIDKANTPVDKARILMFQTISYVVNMEWEKSIDAGLEGLEYLGIKIKKNPSMLNVIIEFVKTKWAIRRVKLKNINQLTPLTNPEKILILDFFERIGASAYFYGINLVSVLGFRGTRFCIENGYSASGTSCFLAYAITLVSFQDYDQGYDICKLALQLVDKYDDNRMKSRAYVVASVLITPWKISYREGLQRINKAYSYGKQAGELLYCSYAACLIPQQMFSLGERLEDISIKFNNVVSVPKFINDPNALASIKFFELALPVLKENENPSVLYEYLNPFLKKPTGLMDQTVSTTVSLFLIATYLLEDWENALKLVQMGEKYRHSVGVTLHFQFAEYVFFAALVYLSLYQRADFFDRIRYRRAIKFLEKRLEKMAKLCPANFESRYQIIKAARLHLNNQFEESEKIFNQAISTFHEQNNLMLEAISNEIAGRLYKSSHLEKHARLFLQKSANVYEAWGCKSKLTLLHNLYPDIISIKKDSDTIQDTFAVTSYSSTHTTTALDFASLMKSIQTISSKVHLEDLIKSFVKIMMENSGASRCLLLLERDNVLELVAKCEALDEDVQFFASKTIDPKQELCMPLVQYVLRTQETVILSNATQEGAYIEDPYVIEHRPFSVMCFLIIHKGQALGVLYLENNLTTSAFSTTHLDILKLLSGQAAISLQNSQLFFASDRFVPHEVLDILGKHSIVDIHIGDNTQKEMTVMFCDIRAFTTLAEQLTPAETFKILNEYLSYMEPIITEYGGFIDKFIGDAIVALFPGDADNAVQASISMQEEVEKFNQVLVSRDMKPFRVGIGLNSGNLILGTLGGRYRMETSVVSDAVNIASEIQDLTKEYNSSLLVSGQTYNALRDRDRFQSRYVGKILLQEKVNEIEIWEIYSADVEERRYAKLAIAAHYDRAIDLFNQKSYSAALQLFMTCLEKLPDDKVIQQYIEKCEAAMAQKTE